MTRTEFESIIIEDIINHYPNHKEKLQKQLLSMKVKDRKISTYGFSTYFVINNPENISLGSGINLKLETDGWKVNGLHRGSGYVLWIENGLIHSLEGFSYEEPWHKEILFCEKI